MVRPPPPRSASMGQEDTSSSSVRSTHRNKGLEWSLRNLRNKIDTGAQHFLTNYYGGEDDSDSDEMDDTLEDMTAYDIFKGKINTGSERGSVINGGGGGSSHYSHHSHHSGHHGMDSHRTYDSSNQSVWAALNAPLRTGIVDGRKVVFELVSDQSKKPITSREERLKTSHVILNADQSNWEVRLRFWMMHFSVATLSVAFFATFIILNVLFAIGFYFLESNKCCGDSSFTFADVFNFAIQTSTTIGYGSFSPSGHVSNLLVVILSYISTLINTLFAGLLFTKFVTPVINIQFSDVMTLCNVNGVPCLSFRLGNADGHLNRLTDINVRLTYSYQIPYIDHKGENRFFRQTDELKLLSSRQHGLLEVWTLRHVLDEASPLFGLNFEEHPGDKIYVFTLSVDAVQDLTKSSVNVQTEYALEDIMIGHTFQNQVQIDMETRIAESDYSKMSDIEPYPVWYPAKRGAYAQDL